MLNLWWLFILKNTWRGYQKHTMRMVCSVFLCINLDAIPLPAQNQTNTGLFPQHTEWRFSQPAYEIPQAGPNDQFEVSNSNDGLQYDLYAKGNGLGGTKDEASYFYTQKSGSWSFTGKIKLNKLQSFRGKAEGGFMIRSNERDNHSAFYAIGVRRNAELVNDNSFRSYWRQEAGQNVMMSQKYNDILQILLQDEYWVRLSHIQPLNLLMTEYSTDGIDWQVLHSTHIDMPNDVAVGLYFHHTGEKKTVYATFNSVSFGTVNPVAVRTLPQETITPGQHIPVSLEISNPNQTGQSVRIEETVPNGWAVQNISQNGTRNENTIQWQLDAPAEQTTLTYELIPPSGGFQYEKIHGKINQTPIFGDLSLNGDLGLFDRVVQLGSTESLPNKSTNIQSNFGSIKHETAAEEQNYHLAGTGSFYWSAVEEGLYLHTKKTGAWTLTAKIEADQINDGVPYSALMVREDPASSISRQYAIGILHQLNTNHESYVYEVSRFNIGDPIYNLTIIGPDQLDLLVPPQGMHLRVSRYPSLNLFISEWSMDGVTWNRGQQKVIPMRDEVSFGLFLNHGSFDGIKSASAWFKNVTFEPAVPYAIRSFTPGFYQPNEPQLVELKVVNDTDHPVPVQIEEIPPKSWTVESVSKVGKIGKDSVSFTLDAPPGNTLLSYTVRPGTGSLQTKVFRGSLNSSEIQGAKSIGAKQTNLESPIASSWRFWTENDGLDIESQAALTQLTVSRVGHVNQRVDFQNYYYKLDGYQVKKFEVPESVIPTKFLNVMDTPHLMENPACDVWTWYIHGGLKSFTGMVGYINSKWKTFTLPNIPKTPLYWHDGMLPATKRYVFYTIFDSPDLYALDAETEKVLNLTASNPLLLGSLSSLGYARDGGVWVTGEYGVTKVHWDNEENLLKTIQFTTHPLQSQFLRNGQILTRPMEIVPGQLSCQWSDAVTRAPCTSIFYDVQKKTWRDAHPNHKLGFIDEYGVEWGIDENGRLKTIDKEGDMQFFTESMLSTEVVDIAPDPTGDFWVSTQFGLARKTQWLWRSPPQVSGVKEPVYSIHEDDEGAVWFTGASKIFRIKNGAWSVYQLPNEITTAVRPGHMPDSAPLGNGINAFSGFFQEKLHTDISPNLLVFNAENETFDYLPMDGTGLSAMIPFQNNETLVRTSHGLLYRFDGVTLTPYLEIDSKTINNAFQPLLQNTNGQLLVASNSRIDIYPRIDKANQTGQETETQMSGALNGQIQHIQIPDKSGTTRITAMHESSDLSVWLGTGDKLFRLKDQVLQEELSDIGTVNQIITDSKDSLWVATGKGLYRNHMGTWLHHNQKDGLPHPNVYSVFEDSRGRIWAGTARGLRVYDPNADTQPPDTVVSQSTLQYRPHDSVEYPVSGMDMWKVTQAEDLLFSYRLNGGTWTKFKPVENLEIGRLVPSPYTIEVRSMDRNWNIDPTPVEFNFRVQHPWHMQTEVMMLFISGFIIIFLTGYFGVTRHFQLQTSLIKLNDAQRSLKEAKNRAEMATQAKSQFLAKMSHEIRTPLNGIIGNLELLTLTKPDRKQSDLLNSAHLAAQTLIGIIGDVLDFAKIEANRMEIDYAEISLHSLIEEVFSMMCVRAQQNHIMMSSEIDASLPQKVVSDPVRVRQLLINLIGNSIKFTNEGGIFLRVYCGAPTENGVNVHFEVLDTGEGFDPSKNEALFEEFVQDDDNALKTQGTGLGLAICRRIVELMGGEIHAEGHKGYGAKFYFHLPLKVVEEAKPLPEISRSIRATLVMDKEYQSYSALKSILQQVEYPLDTASPQDFFSSVQHDDFVYPDIVFVACKELPAEAANWKPLLRNQRTRWALISESTDPVLPFQAHRLGFHFVIQPPLSHERIHKIFLSERQISQMDYGKEVSVIHIEEVMQQLSQCKMDAPVLVVDDTKTNRLLARNQLLELGVKCDLAENGLEALEKAKAVQYPMILIDCSMPVMDGFEFTRQFREWEKYRYQHTPVVAMTAHVVSGDEERCLESGMDDYLSKPVRIERLAEVLLKWMKVQAEKKAETGTSEQTSIPVDIDSLRRDLGIEDKEDILEILEAFLEDMEEIVERMKTAITQQDRMALRDQAHAAKSAANSSAVFALAEWCKQLEYAAPEDEWDVLQDLANRLYQEYERAKGFIETQLNEG